MEPILIIGQGIAGTLLGWTLERAGVDFRIVDRGHERAASRVAAGLVNPVAGQRLVKSWRVDELLPLAREVYRRMGEDLGIPLWHDLRVRRLFRDDRERLLLTRRQAEGALSPYLGASDADGFWIEGAGRVDVPGMLAAAGARWRRSGRLVAGEFAPTAREEAGLAIHCTGASVRVEPAFSLVPWQVAQGELLTLAATGLEPGVVKSRGHWVLPHGQGEARVGATYAPGVEDGMPTLAGRDALAASAGELLPQGFQITAHEAGVRLATPDKRPVAGRSPSAPQFGICAGLGSKGVLLAPWLARQWCEHLVAGAGFDPEVDVRRFKSHAGSG